MFRALKTYDLCFRAKQGLPLPARPLTNLLILSALARTQRTEKVQLSHCVWMSNHPHMQLYAMDAQDLRDFYGETQKRLTDSVKKLLGLDHLNLWEDHTTVAEVLDLECAVERIVYAYLNPVRAKLCSSIDEYQGLNTWKEFLSAPADLNSSIKVEVPWIRMHTIEPLSSPNPSVSEETSVITNLLELNKENPQTLTIYPFAWLKPFGISDPKEIESVRQRIITRVREEEVKLAVPPRASRRDSFLITNYKPKKKERKVFFYASTKELRFDFLNQFAHFKVACRECFTRLKAGFRNVLWPPGGFAPAPPIIYNALG